MIITKNKRSLIVFLGVLLSFQCSWIPLKFDQKGTEVSPTIDSIVLYYSNLNITRFAAIGPKLFMGDQLTRKISLCLSSSSHTDSLLALDLISLLESSKNADSLHFVPREHWKPYALQIDSITVFESYHNGPGIDVFYVIESIYSSGQHDTVSLGRFVSTGVYHSNQSYITNDNGLLVCLIDLLSEKDPEWAIENSFFLSKENQLKHKNK